MMVTAVMMVKMTSMIMMMRGGLNMRHAHRRDNGITSHQGPGHSGQVNSEFHDSGNLRNFFPAPAFPLTPLLNHSFCLDLRQTIVTRASF